MEPSTSREIPITAFSAGLDILDDSGIDEAMTPPRNDLDRLQLRHRSLSLPSFIRSSSAEGGCEADNELTTTSGDDDLLGTIDEENEDEDGTDKSHLHRHHGYCSCTGVFSPSVENDGGRGLFQAIHSPCTICSLSALYSFVLSKPVDIRDELGHEFGCAIRHRHQWWHHIGREAPEIHMDSLQMISHWGYRGDEHKVITDDGFILTMHRIRARTKKSHPPVVFLQHGLEGSSADWISNEPNASAGFLFADAGFDVWMGNSRGNRYSMKHTCFIKEDPLFWDFSWDQMAKYDLEASIDYVLKHTKSETLHYIGHSQGCLTALTKLSIDPVFASKIESFFALAPVATLKHIQGFIKYIAIFTKPIQWFFETFGVKQFLANSWMVKLVIKTACYYEMTHSICANVLFAVSGPDTKQLEESRLPVYLAHIPSGTSTKNIAHFGQMVITGKCQMFDYGSPEENNKRYSQSIPPVFDMGTVDVPTYVFSGSQDWLSNPWDVQSGLIEPMTESGALKEHHVLNNFNHLDFLWGQKAPKQVYLPIVDTVRKLERARNMSRRKSQF